MFLVLLLSLLALTQSFVIQNGEIDFEFEEGANIAEFNSTRDDAKWVQNEVCGSEKFLHIWGVSRTGLNSIYYQKFLPSGIKLKLVEQVIIYYGGPPSDDLRFALAPDCENWMLTNGHYWELRSGTSGAFLKAFTGTCQAITMTGPKEFTCSRDSRTALIKYDAEDLNNVIETEKAFGEDITNKDMTSSWFVRFSNDDYGLSRGDTHGWGGITFGEGETGNIRVRIGTEDGFAIHDWGEARLVKYPPSGPPTTVTLPSAKRDCVYYTCRDNSYFNNLPQGSYTAQVRCANGDKGRSRDCDFKIRIEWQYTSYFTGGMYGCTGELVPMGSYFALSCPGYNYDNVRFLENVGIIALFDSDMTYIDNWHPKLTVGGTRFAEKYVIAGSKIFATYVDVEDSNKIKIVVVTRSGSQLLPGKIVYDTGLTDINAIKLVADSDTSVENLYLVVGTEITVLRPLSPLDGTLEMVTTFVAAGDITTVSYNFETGNLIFATDSGTHLTGFVVQEIDSDIPSTESTLIYNVYKNNLIPATSADYLLLPAAQAFVPNVLEMSKEKLIDRYVNTPTWSGFIFDSNDELKFVLKRRSASPKLIGSLGVSADGYNFYEMRPILTKWFDWEEPSSCVPEGPCMFTANSTVMARDLCQNITRCEGYHGGCLVEARSYGSCGESETVIYHRKKYRHDVFKVIEEDPLFYIIGASVITVVHFLYVQWIASRTVRVRRVKRTRVKPVDEDSETEETKSNFEF